MRKVVCTHKHRMVQIVPDLWLCECSSYGRISDLKGAVEEARKAVEAAGGIAVLRDRVEAEEAQARADAKDRAKERQETFSKRIRAA